MNRRLKIIDYFKGVSIILIIVCHISQVFNLPHYVSAVTSLGQMGCQIFFVLSGYTVTRSYYKNCPSIKSFYKKRWLSLAPGYWLSITITVLIGVITICLTGTNQLDTSLRPGDIIINFCLLNGIAPTDANNSVFRGGWFIGTLSVFYFLYPLLFKGYTRYGNIFLYKCIIVCIITSCLLFLLTGNIYSGCGGFLYFSFVNQFPPFILGILLYRNSINNKNAKVKTLLLFLLFLMLFYLPFFPFRAVLVPFVFSLSFVDFLIVFWNKRLLCCRLLSQVGLLSYPMFLVHIFFVWDIPKFIFKPILLLNPTFCIVWCIISIILVYYVSVIYNKVIIFFSNIIESIMSIRVLK